MRFSVFGFVAAVTLAAAATVHAVERFAHVIERAMLFVIDILARPVARIERLFDTGAIVGGSRLAYDGPTMDLRHEAGTSRRAAARGV